MNLEPISGGGVGGGVSDGSNDGELLEWNGTIWVPTLMSGSSWPSVVYAGKKFTRDDRGSGTDYTLKSLSPDIWVPDKSRGPMTIYIDPAGTDDKDHGFGSGADAFKTFMTADVGAIAQIPALVGGDLGANVSGDRFQEDLVFRGKKVTGPFNISFNGTFTIDEVVSNCNIFTSQTIGHTGASFTPSAHIGKLVYIFGGTGAGQYRVILDNNATTIFLLEKTTWDTTPDATSDFRVLVWDSIIEGTTNCITVDTNQGAVIFNDLHFDGNTNDARAINVKGYSSIDNINRCRIEGDAAHGNRIETSNASFADCYVTSTKTSNAEMISVFSFVSIVRCWVKGGLTTVLADEISRVFVGNSKLQSISSGVGNGLVSQGSSASFMSAVWVGDYNNGIFAQRGGGIRRFSMTYSGNNTDETAIAGTYGTITA